MAGPIGYSTILGSMSRTLSRLVPAMTSQARVRQRWRAINAIEGALNTLVIIVGEGVTAALTTVDRGIDRIDDGIKLEGP